MVIKKLLLISTAVLVLMLTTSCSKTINSLRMMQINSDVKPVYASSERIKLKSIFLGEKPYVYAKINGENLLFLLDSGARFLMLMDTPKVKNLRLRRGFDLSLGGWGEQEDSQAFQTDISRLDFGGVQFEQMSAAIIPISKSYYYLREDEAIHDGVIGHDIMRHFTWEINAKNNEIYISQTKYQPEATAQYFKLEEFFSKISIEAKLAFNHEHVVDGEFIIDTGSRHYVKLSAAFPTSNDIEITSARVKAADFGLSGKVEHERVTLPLLSLENIKINNVKVNLIPSDDEDDWWIIGNALMNQFKTVIDYKNEAFYLVPQNNFVTDYNLLGLELRKVRTGEFVVRYLFPQLAAAETSIKVGDLITKINGKSAIDISLSEYNDIASQIGKHQICIQRENQCFSVEATHIEGYSDL